ncbi:futalosine hydrolase [Albibacterium bauzanense]|uniref:Futalosine hydrolase n=1 Tax=Albibacterium bauzanense TaxID=653929 RepID=A0A4R1LWT7_9SPHI|nr:futalosine hydrolase [Albibacterium bauzanense]TCK83000.1 futalosine hydrolase [Albibacterium bauzanense]
MKLLVVAATRLEIEPFLQAIKSKSYSIDVLIGGVGMIAISYELGKKLALTKYDALLNVGIAGSFDPNLKLGTVVRVKSDVFSELGAEDDNNFLSIEDMGFGNSIYHENAPSFIKYNSVSTLRGVKGITVNTVHGNLNSIDIVSKRLKPEIESMEGAAVFYAAQQEGISCLQVRSISNWVEKRNRSNWQIELAIKNLNDWLIKFSDELFS